MRTISKEGIKCRYSYGEKINKSGTEPFYSTNKYFYLQITASKGKEEAVSIHWGIISETTKDNANPIETDELVLTIAKNYFYNI